VTAQQVTPEHFQVPEPWNGDLASAPLLFMSSNPATGDGAAYPRASWKDEEIEDFFVHRFGEGRQQWTLGGNRALLLDGTHAKANPFWSSVRQRAMELFQRDVQPGRDYALTEVVRCKSGGEYGVAEAADECAGRYLLPTIEASGAKVIVALGKVAESYLRRLVAFEGKVSPPVTIGGRERMIAVLPHPNARKHRSFAQCFGDADLLALRACVQLR